MSQGQRNTQHETQKNEGRNSSREQHKLSKHKDFQSDKGSLQLSLHMAKTPSPAHLSIEDVMVNLIHGLFTCTESNEATPSPRTSTTYWQKVPCKEVENWVKNQSEASLQALRFAEQKELIRSTSTYYEVNSSRFQAFMAGFVSRRRSRTNSNPEPQRHRSRNASCSELESLEHFRCDTPDSTKSWREGASVA